MKIWQEYSKREKRPVWKARFQFKGNPYWVVEDTKTELLAVIDEIKSAERKKAINQKYGTDLPVPNLSPTLKELFDKILESIHVRKTRVFKKRVFDNFLSLIPTDIKIIDIVKADFQSYITKRRAQIGEQSGKPIKTQTIYKELYQVSAALNARNDHFPRNQALEDWKPPKPPKAPPGLKRKSQRSRVVTQDELHAVINELYKRPAKPQNFHQYFSRVRLGHTLEFAYWTGLRRKEISNLKFSQFDKKQDVLTNVVRFKTSDVQPIYPLAKRAVEIITERRGLQKDTPYIFSNNGNPIESNYRTMKNVCDKLRIPYGTFQENGFVIHDLRRNFGTEILKETDIETTRRMLGHTNISQTQTYVTTDIEEMKRAIRRRDKINYNDQLGLIFDEMGSVKISKQDFTEKIKKLFGEN